MFLIALLVGLVMIVVGAELLVRGGGKLALALRVPALVVGLTVVAFGTSTPELAVSVTAALRASTEMALANVTGSNIANIALVLGLAAIVTPIHVDRGLIRREVPVTLGLQIAIPLLCLDGTISRFEGLLLLLAGISYNSWLVWDAWTRRTMLRDLEENLEELGVDEEVLVGERAIDWRKQLAVLLLGLLVLLVGAQFFVHGGVRVAELLGLSDRYIGLTVIALGTSAPEVATAVVSAYRDQADLALGNSLGSNILNMTMVLSITALVAPIQIVDRWAFMDLGVAVVVTAMLIPMVLRDAVVTRLEGTLMVAAYALYLFLLSS